MECALAVAVALAGFASSALDTASQRQREGQYAQAMLVFQSAEPIVTGLGPASLVHARWENNLASLMFRQGDLAGAEKHFRRALLIWDKAGPAQEPDKARTLMNLAGLENVRGKPDSARRLLEEAVSIQRRNGGEGLAATLTTFSEALAALGDREGAGRALAEARAAIAERAHSVEDAVALELAACSQAQKSGDFAAAGKSCSDAEQIARRAYPAQDPRYAHVRLRQGQLSFIQGRYDEAAEHLLQAARGFAETGPQGLFHSRALFQLALVRRAQWQLPAAVGLLNRARPGLEANLAPADPERIQFAIIRADLLRQTGRKDEAETAARDALTLAETNGRRVDLISEALNTLGVVLYERKDSLDDSAAAMEEAISLRESIDGAGSLASAQFLQNLAQVRLAQHRYADAVRLAKRICEIRTSVRGPDDPSLAEPLAVWAKALTATGEKRTARDLQKRADRLHRNDPTTAAAQGILSLSDLTRN